MLEHVQVEGNLHHPLIRTYQLSYLVTYPPNYPLPADDSYPSNHNESTRCRDLLSFSSQLRHQHQQKLRHHHMITLSKSHRYNAKILAPSLNHLKNGILESWEPKWCQPTNLQPPKHSIEPKIWHFTQRSGKEQRSILSNTVKTIKSTPVWIRESCPMKNNNR